MSAALIGEVALDAAKALQLLPLVTSTLSAAQSSLTTDQHADVVTKTLDLLNVAGTSATAVANSGTVGTADAQHIKDAVAAVDAAAPLEGAFAAFIAGIKKAFSWI